MPSVEFYAVQADIAKLLGFVFAETDCRVYEAYSVPGQPLREFTSAEDALAAYRLDHDHPASPPRSWSSGRPAPDRSLPAAGSSCDPARRKEQRAEWSWRRGA
jgi:hypothetical protein